MIVIRLSGGLGNQMFQYAYARSLSLAYDMKLYYDDSFYYHKDNIDSRFRRNIELGCFNLGIKHIRLNRFNKLLMKELYEQSPYNVEKKRIMRNSNYILNGYFQSERYFENYKEQIALDFNFKPVLGILNKLVSVIKSDTNSVGVLIRRDDYLCLQEDVTLSRQYYTEAFKLIKSKIRNPKFYLFSIGDTEWAKENFSKMNDVVIIENDLEGMKGYEKMRLMSLCQHNIIANSSFGWWSAWLNSNKEKIVIMPKKWTAEEAINQEIEQSRVPRGWIQV